MMKELGPWEFLGWMFMAVGGTMFMVVLLTQWLTGPSISSYDTDRKCRCTCNCKGRR